MHHYLQVEVKARIRFTDAEMMVIIAACSLHYDATVKAATQPGGFLYGANNRWRFAQEDGKPEDWDWDFSFRELDLITKGLEMSRNQLAPRISFDIGKVLCDMNERGLLINTALHPQNKYIIQKLAE